MKKTYKLKRPIVWLLICILLTGVFAVSSEAAVKVKTFHVNAYMRNPIQVKIGWKKKDVDKYVIYRAEATKEGRVGKYERIGDASGKKTHYVDKLIDMKIEDYWQNEVPVPAKYYSYKVCGYKKIDDKYTRVYQGTRMVYTGAWYTDWDEYQHCDAQVSPESIPLRVWAGQEFEPDYYRIYRSEDGKNFKMLTEIKSSKYGVEYIDKDVEAGKSYYYKARTYRMAGKEKIFSDYTRVLKHSAVNQFGQYTYEILTPDNVEITELVMKLKSHTNNGELVFTGGIGWSALSYFTEYFYEGDPVDAALDLVGYSYDNETFEEFGNVQGEKLTIKADETIYLRFSTRNGITFKYLGTAPEVIGETELYFSDLSYNDLTSILNFSQDEGKNGGSARAAMIGEYYH